jgi:hypothetical protein
MIDLIVAFLSGSSPYHAELRTFGQAFMGALTVRSGANKNKDMNWFHAFALTTISAFGGGWFGFIWMGKPTSLITNGDVTLTLTAIAFVLLTYTPMNIGYMFGRMLPVKILLNSWAQLFRGLGMIGFINACAAEVAPSKYYPTAVLGPVVYGTLLGNMGAFFLKGFHNHLEKDIPWAFQNGLVVGFFYHIYTHDKEGSIGISLRSAIQSTGIQGTLDDKLFATIVVTGFMQLSGMLMLPEFYGPSFNLLLLPKIIFTSLTSTSSKNYRPGLVKEQSVVYREPKENAAAPGGKRKRKKKKKN